jgi:DtxR family Mn-dependent transcriptional regulator
MLEPPENQLTPALQDYLETISALDAAVPGARITDIAATLGTKLPTVVRSVARLRELGLVNQVERGRVYPTPAGAALAAQLAHRHEDVVRFLGEVLGVGMERAEADACVLEHGLSAESAQRLHEFLERWDALPERLRRTMASRASRKAPDFNLLGEAAGAGSRR